MHGHLPEMPAETGEGLVLFQRADVLEETDGVRDGLRDGRFHSLEQERGGGPRAGSHRRRAAAAFAPEAGRLGEHSHLQAQFLEGRSLHLRQLEIRERRHARGRVQAIALPGPHATGAASALLRGRARDPRGLQRRHPGERVVGFFLESARVDDEDDVVDGHRRLGDVGGQHHLLHPARRALEHALLLRGRHHGVQGQDQDVRAEARVGGELVPELRNFVPSG